MGNDAEEKFQMGEDEIKKAEGFLRRVREKYKEKSEIEKAMDGLVEQLSKEQVSILVEIVGNAVLPKNNPHKKEMLKDLVGIIPCPEKMLEVLKDAFFVGLWFKSESRDKSHVSNSPEINRMLLRMEKTLAEILSSSESRKRTFPPLVPPSLPPAKIDRATSEELLPLFLTKGIFSNFNKIPNIQDLATQEAKKIGRKLTAKEKRDLEIKTKEYKKDGYVWREFPQYAIGFSYMQFEEYLEEIERKYQEKKREAETKPFLFPDMKKEIEEVLKKVRLYKKGQSLAYGILGEVFLQKRFWEVGLTKERAVYYIGKNPRQKEAYQQVKEILNSLRWLSYKIVGRKGAKIKGAVGNFVFNIEEKGREYVLDINPKYVGCITHFAEDKKLHTKQERKELFNRGYFNFPTKALAIAGDYSAATEEFRNYILRETGNKHLNTKQHKVISRKIKIYINKAYLRHSRKRRNYQAFIKEVLPTLMRDKFITKLDPPLNKLRTLSPKKAYETNLRLYIPYIEDLDRNLREILEERVNTVDA